MNETRALFLRPDFAEEFDRRHNNGRPGNVRQRAAILDIPPSSLGHMMTAPGRTRCRPVNVDIIRALTRISPPGTDVYALYTEERPLRVREGQPEPIGPTPAWTVADLALAWSCTPGHIYNLIHRGELQRTDIGHRRAKIRITKASAEAYMDRHTSRVKAA